MSKGKLRAIKKRIESTNSTMQITRAMEMVARAKLNKIRKGLQYIRLYEQSMKRALERVWLGLDSHPAPSGQGELLLIITSDMGLAGAFNSEILKLAEQTLSKSDTNYIITVGVKAESYFKKYEMTSSSYSHFYDTPDHEEAAIIVDDVMDIMENKKLRSLKMVYSNFKNALIQLPKSVNLLPVGPFSRQERDVYDYEPEVELLYRDVLDSWLISEVLLGLYETKVGELYARQNAMKNATENAKNMIETLTLARNKLRQSNITQEIIEVVNGAESLNG